MDNSKITGKIKFRETVVSICGREVERDSIEVELTPDEIEVLQMNLPEVDLVDQEELVLTKDNLVELLEKFPGSKILKDGKEVDIEDLP